MRPVVVLVVAALFATAAARGGECPPPKKLTCDQLKAKLADRCEPEAPTVKVVDRVVEVAKPCPACPTCSACPEARNVEVLIPVQKKPYGEWFAGAGPIFSQGWGATAVVGYKFSTGWMVMGGPTRINHDPTMGSTGCPQGGSDYRSDHDSHSHPPPCQSTSWTVPAGSPWGGQVLALHTF